MPDLTRSLPFLFLAALITVLLGVTLFVPLTLAVNMPPSRCNLDIRAHIKNAPKIVMTVPAGTVAARWKNEKTGRQLREWGRAEKITLSASERGMLLNSSRAGTSSMIITPSQGRMIRMGRYAYLGSMIVSRYKNGQVLAVCKVPLNVYVKGVLAREMGAGFRLAALEAQAVAARTYAAWAMQRRSSGRWHVRAGVEQPYFGDEGIDSKISLAVVNTEGVVMLSEGRLFPAYYSAACGGTTENVENVFGTRPIKALSSSKCVFCSKHGGALSWSHQTTLGRIEHNLKKKRLIPSGFNLGRLVFRKNPGAGTHYHYVILESSDTGQQQKRILADALRKAIGTRKLRSTAFEVRISKRGRKKQYFFYNGRGWGHAVGLCQYGADGLALGLEAGREAKSEEILRTYYRDVAFIRLY